MESLLKPVATLNNFLWYLIPGGILWMGQIFSEHILLHLECTTLFFITIAGFICHQLGRLVSIGCFKVYTRPTRRKVLGLFKGLNNSICTTCFSTECLTSSLSGKTWCDEIDKVDPEFQLFDSLLNFNHPVLTRFQNQINSDWRHFHCITACVVATLTNVIAIHSLSNSCPFFTCKLNFDLPCAWAVWITLALALTWWSARLLRLINAREIAFLKVAVPLLGHDIAKNCTLENQFD